ncbi:MAG: HNH endonuclease [Clostridia bacterium]|nr:HNH endonuclease [Clostridia bacterium]
MKQGSKVLDSRNSIEYRTIIDILEDVVGVHYKTFQRGVYDKFKDKKIIMWFPQISTDDTPITNSGWVNKLLDGNCTIESYNIKALEKNKINNKERNEIISRVVFGKKKNGMYRFYGVFTLITEQIKEGHLFCKKVSDSVAFVDGKPTIIFSDKDTETIEDLEWENQIQQDFDSIICDTDTGSSPQVRPEPILSGNHLVFPRDRRIAANALRRANFMCEYNTQHPVFLRRRHSINYTEPHHLVPMSYQSQIEARLDCEANIVSLCSSCHNQIHYGDGGEQILMALYQARKEALHKAGIDITEETLLDIYGFKQV